MGGEGKKAVGEGQPNSRHGDNAEQEAWGPAAWLGGSMQAVTSNLARLPAHILLKPNTQRMRAISPFSRIVKPVMGLTGGHRAVWRGHLSYLRSDLSLVSQDRLFFFCPKHHQHRNYPCPSCAATCCVGNVCTLISSCPLPVMVKAGDRWDAREK